MYIHTCTCTCTCLLDVYNMHCTLYCRYVAHTELHGPHQTQKDNIDPLEVSPRKNELIFASHIHVHVHTHTHVHAYMYIHNVYYCTSGCSHQSRLLESCLAISSWFLVSPVFRFSWGVRRNSAVLMYWYSGSVKVDMYMYAHFKHLDCKASLYRYMYNIVYMCIYIYIYMHIACIQVHVHN